MSEASLLISILALLFTVFSFWWMNWRKGELQVSPPRSYAACTQGGSRLVMEFPFVFFNDGPTPIIVHNLRLLMPDESEVRPLKFSATLSKVGSDEGRRLATQFPVRGREAILMVYEFHRQPAGILFASETYDVQLQAKLDKNKEWKTLCEFSLPISEKAAAIMQNQLIPQDIEAD